MKRLITLRQCLDIKMSFIHHVSFDESSGISWHDLKGGGIMVSIFRGTVEMFLRANGGGFGHQSPLPVLTIGWCGVGA